MHELCESTHSLYLAVDQGNTVRDVERFIKRRLRSLKDIALLKGAHYYMVIRQQNELRSMLGENMSLEEFLEGQEQLQEHEEIVHPLTEGQAATGTGIQQEEESSAPLTLHFEKARSLGPEPSAVPVAAAEVKSSSRVGYRFFFNGRDVKDKSELLFELVRQAGATVLERLHEM